MALTWSLQSNAPQEDLAIISNGVLSYGRTHSKDGNSEPISCLVRSEGAVVAGASGRTEYARLFINYLWVSEALRKNGIARRILIEIESAAARRGCRDSLIETLDESVAGLYARLGYQTVTIIRGYVGHFNRHIMLKPSLGPAK